MSLLNNLVAYYKLDDPNDALGLNNLTNVNSVTFDSGVIGNCADLTPSNTNKTLKTSSTYGMTYNSPRSISCWVNMPVLPTGTNLWVVFALIFNTSPGNYTPILYHGTNGWEDGTSTLIGGTALPNTWYHVVTVVDWVGGTIKTYINNLLVATHATFSGNFAANTGGFSIGQQTNVWWGSVKVDEVGIWNRVLTSTEVTQLYNSGVGLQYPFTVTPPPTANTNQAFFAYFN